MANLLLSQLQLFSPFLSSANPLSHVDLQQKAPLFTSFSRLTFHSLSLWEGNLSAIFSLLDPIAIFFPPSGMFLK